jgi:biopolymer transport protein TolR
MSVRILNGRGRSRRGYTPMSEINVTPMVDVMLVLLVVFMITAPLLSVGVPIDLPKATADSLQGQEEPLTVTVDREARVYLQETEIDMRDLVPRLAAIAQARGSDPRIFVRGDREIDYGTVMQVMGMINTAGFTKVALVAQSPEQ